MKLRTTDLETGEIRLRITSDPKGISALAALHETEEMRFEHSLTVDLRAFRSRDMIAVQGRLSTRVKLACARCLDLYLEDLDLGFDLSYLQENVPATEELDGETQIEAGEAGLMRFEGETIDLSEAIGEQIIMGLPFKPLCDSDCKGLCSQCGANLNHAGCTCAPSSSDTPFAVLKQLQGDASEQ